MLTLPAQWLAETILQTIMMRQAALAGGLGVQLMYKSPFLIFLVLAICGCNAKSPSFESDFAKYKLFWGNCVMNGNFGKPSQVDCKEFVAESGVLASSLVKLAKSQNANKALLIRQVQDSKDPVGQEAAMEILEEFIDPVELDALYPKIALESDPLVSGHILVVLKSNNRMNTHSIVSIHLMEKDTRWLNIRQVYSGLSLENPSEVREVLVAAKARIAKELNSNDSDSAPTKLMRELIQGLATVDKANINDLEKFREPMLRKWGVDIANKIFNK